MEKYARQHLAEGVQHANELHVDFDSEIFRTLNSHYNRNNQIEVNILNFIKSFFFPIRHTILMIPFLDSSKFLLCNRSNIKRVFQSHSRSQRFRSIVEKSNI